MKSLRDAAVLLILLMLLVSVRITPPEEAQGGIIPEARASMEQAAEPVRPAAMRTAGVASGQSEPDGQSPVRMKTVRTERGTAHMIVIEVEEVETTDPPAAPVPAVELTKTTC